MGDKCVICEEQYGDHIYDIHHIDPSKKEFMFGDVRKNNKALSSLAPELAKCILVCANCHREIHNEEELPEFESSFDSEVFDELLNTTGIPMCQECGGELGDFGYSFCSNSCIGKNNQKIQARKKKEKQLAELKTYNMVKLNKVDWRKVDVLQLIYDNDYNMLECGRQLGISDVGVRRRYNKVMDSIKWVL